MVCIVLISNHRFIGEAGILGVTGTDLALGKVLSRGLYGELLRYSASAREACFGAICIKDSKDVAGGLRYFTTGKGNSVANFGLVERCARVRDIV